MAKSILVCVQHVLTADQLAELKEMGFDPIYLKDEDPELFAKMANSPSTMEEIQDLAREFCNFCLYGNFKTVLLPLGSPALMFAISCWNVTGDGFVYFDALFSYSERVSIEEPGPDGTVVKKQVFKHQHFINMFY